MFSVNNVIAIVGNKNVVKLSQIIQIRIILFVLIVSLHAFLDTLHQSNQGFLTRFADSTNEHLLQRLFCCSVSALH